MGAYIHQKGWDPERVLCSTSKRTRQTLDLLLPEFSVEPQVQFERALYLAEWPVLLREIQDAQAGASPLMVIGHNPGMEQLAIALALQPANTAERMRAQRLAEKFPTAALAVFDFDAASWEEIKPGRGSLIDYVRPKDIAAAAGDDE